CYAYLMEGNMIVDQKLVMAHVFGHCDFFKNNQWFAPTDRKMMDVMANHATRVRRYIDRYGIETVERFIDRCLSLENLIDRYAPYSKTSSAEVAAHEPEPSARMLRDERPYMRDFLRPKAEKSEKKEDEG